MGGNYSPSPGVIYPTLAWLEDMGYTRVEAEGGRKSYAITEEGKKTRPSSPRTAWLSTTCRVAWAQAGGKGGRYEGVPAPVVRDMENLKLGIEAPPATRAARTGRR